jgi:hypothetical protein
MNFSKILKCRRATHVLRFKEGFQVGILCAQNTQFEALSRSTDAGSGEWLGRERSAEVTADAELEDGNENFKSTDFTQSKVFLLDLSKTQELQQLYRKGKFLFCIRDM